MPRRVKIQASELHDANALFISLVPRGAARIPFRVVKSDQPKGGENPMLNFRTLFKSEAPEGPQVLAVVVAKGTDLDAIKPRLEAAGFSTELEQEVEGATLYIQREAELGQSDQITYKASEELGAVIGNVNKEFLPDVDGSFSEVAETRGFFPGFEIALGVLRDAVFKAVLDSDSNEEAREQVSEATRDFRAHIQGLAQSLPSQAFKLEALPEVQKQDEEEEEEVEIPEAAQAPEEETPEVEAQAAEAPAEPGVLAQVQELLGGIKNQLDEGLASLGKRLDEYGTRLETAESVARKADEATRGTVNAASDSDPAARSENGGVDGPPLLDTAYYRIHGREKA